MDRNHKKLSKEVKKGGFKTNTIGIVFPTLVKGGKGGACESRLMKTSLIKEEFID